MAVISLLKMKRNIFIIICIGIFIACKQKPLEFEKLDQFSKVDTMSENGKPYYYKTDVYILKNYRDNLKNERTVDSFSYKNRASNIDEFSSYNIVVYKYSDKTNIDNLRKNPKDFEYYSFVEDMKYLYRWGNGVWSSKIKFEGRRTVEAQPMIREE
jgi:hypothetical protein